MSRRNEAEVVLELLGEIDRLSSRPQARPKLKLIKCGVCARRIRDLLFQGAQRAMEYQMGGVMTPENK